MTKSKQEKKGRKHRPKLSAKMGPSRGDSPPPAPPTLRERFEGLLLIWPLKLEPWVVEGEGFPEEDLGREVLMYVPNVLPGVEASRRANLAAALEQLALYGLDAEATLSILNRALGGRLKLFFHAERVKHGTARYKRLRSASKIMAAEFPEPIKTLLQVDHPSTFSYPVQHIYPEPHKHDPKKKKRRPEEVWAKWADQELKKIGIKAMIRKLLLAAVGLTQL